MPYALPLRMTVPRRVLPHATLMVSRRCLDRMFLLKPSSISNQLFAYILAVAARRHGILLHAFCVLSNHFHLVISDPHARLPAFEQYLDSLVARAFNSLHGRWDFFWSSGSYSAVTLVDSADVLDKMAYVLANPAKAGLVRTGAEWPGLWSSPDQIGGVATRLQRPERFFRKKGPMPETVDLELACPPGFESVDSFRAELSAAVQEREAEAARELAAERRSFLGVQAVLAQPHDARPTTGEPHRGLNPSVACRDKWKRIEVLQRLKEFRAEYRQAWKDFARGLREAVFPHGTYWLRVAWGVTCATG